jgi:DNA invertase Pin-like site-specific DNA recombinase
MAGQNSSLTGKWVAVYVRISQDKTGRAENVATQEKHARKYAASQWPGVPVEVYCDNDLSASDPDVYRPEFERMMNDVRLGRVVQVVSADQERITRRPAVWEEFTVVLGSAGIVETHGYRDGITPVKGSKLVGRVKAAVSAEYIEGNKIKLNEKLDELAAQGRPAGSVVFGYKHAQDAEGRKTLEIEEHRAAAIRWARSRCWRGGRWRTLRAVWSTRATGVCMGARSARRRSARWSRTRPWPGSVCTGARSSGRAIGNRSWMRRPGGLVGRSSAGAGR